MAATTGELSEVASRWRAVWEVGGGSALDGAVALVASGLTGYRLDRLDVSIPHANRHRPVPGVIHHRRRQMPPTVGAGIPRVRPEWAVLHAAGWAVSDRQAMLLLCLVVQQRLVRPADLQAAAKALGRTRRRALIQVIVKDVCDGAHPLGELDVAALCRARGLPEPTRQVVRRTSDGRIYLDLAWDGIGLVVEIDGGHHQLALNPVDDALRQNEVALDGDIVLRIPLAGLRLAPDRFMNQLVRAHAVLARRQAAQDATRRRARSASRHLQGCQPGGTVPVRHPAGTRDAERAPAYGSGATDVMPVAPLRGGEVPASRRCSLEGDGRAGALELLLGLLGRSLVDLLQDGLGGAVNEVLGLLQAEGGQRADLLDDLDLLLTSGLEDDVELVLLLDSGSVAATGGRAGGRNRDRGGSGDTEGVLELLDELGELDQGHLLEGLKELVGAELRHDGRPFFLRVCREWRCVGEAGPGWDQACSSPLVATSAVVGATASVPSVISSSTVGATASVPSVGSSTAAGAAATGPVASTFARSASTARAACDSGAAKR